MLYAPSLPKPDKDTTFLKNYRPISLLNVDYKICSKALASRIKKLIPSLISANHTGFVRFILDTIEYCKINNTKGLLLLIDFEKAFGGSNGTSYLQV